MSTSRTTSPSSLSQTPLAPWYRRHWRLLTLLLVITALVTAAFAWTLSQVGCSTATDPTRPGAVTEYCIEHPFQQANYGSMTTGPDGNFWFVDYASHRVARMTPRGVITDFSLAVPPAAPFISPTALPMSDIAPGADDRLWYIADSKLGYVSTQGKTGVVTLPTGTQAASVAPGLDGSLWVDLVPGSTGSTGSGTALIARMTATGQFTEYTIPPSGAVGALTTASDGSLWFIGYPYDPSTPTVEHLALSGAVSVFSLQLPGPPPSCGSGCVLNPTVNGLAAGQGGSVWFIDGWGHVGQLTARGDVTYHRVAGPANLGEPAIGRGPGGSIWFSAETSAIGYIAAQGAVTTYPLPHTGDVASITAGADGGVWFQLRQNHALGFFQPMRIVRVTP